MMTEQAIMDALTALPGWDYDAPRKAIHRRIILKDFPQAMALMVRIGMEAEKRDHHPEWTNVYNRLDIWLTTHDAGGVSLRDIELAAWINAVV